jgi:hypothetical protein
VRGVSPLRANHLVQLTRFGRSRLCAEQRPFKRDEDGGFIVEVKGGSLDADTVEVSTFGGSCDMDDDPRQQHPTQHGGCHLDRCDNDSSGGAGGEERLVESLGAVAINKRRKIGP